MGLSGSQENEENVLENVRALLPELRAAAARTDALRHVPEESVVALKKTGAFRLMQPARFGGLELGLDSLLRVSAEVGRACGSTSWCVAVLAIHNWFLGLFPEEAQKEVWGADPDAVLASVFASMGRARPEEGGFRLEGRWQFASGSDHGDWITVGAMVDHGTKLPLPDVRSFLVPRKDFRIEDTWHVAGLRGTGSKDVVIENAHVPSHRILNFAEAHCGKSPGSRINTSPLYRMPFASVLTMTLACPALGVARGMLENFCERAAARTVLFGGAKQSEQSHSHIAISEA
ncbi:MAG: acyl-CoA dehydrogenase family protein, partial [Bdellovibrionota bacterium]